MAPSEMPAKKGSEEFRNLATTLATRWKLPLPLEKEYSPSKLARDNKVAALIVSQMSYLYWKDDGLLDKVLTDFSRRASILSSGWVAKPLQDPGTLPRSSASQGIYEHGVGPFTEKDIHEMSSILLKLLENETTRLKVIARSADRSSIRPSSPDTNEAPLQYESPSPHLAPHPPRSPSPSSIPSSGVVQLQSYSALLDEELGQENPPTPEALTCDSDDAEFWSLSAAVDPSPILHSSHRPSFARLSVPNPTSIGPPSECDVHSESGPEVFITPPSSPRSSAISAPPLLRTYEVTGMDERSTVSNLMKNVQNIPIPQVRGHSYGEKEQRDYKVHEYLPMPTVTKGSSIGREPMQTHKELESLSVPVPVMNSFLSDLSASRSMKDTSSQSTIPSHPSSAATSFRDDECNGRSNLVFRSKDEPKSKTVYSQLCQQGPLAERPLPEKFLTASLRDRYEMTRFVLNQNASIYELSLSAPLPFQSYTALAQWMYVSQNGSTPVLSSPKAWEEASDRYRGVVLSGSLQYNVHRNGPLLQFQLHPLKVDKSYRLSRRFGNDRFLFLSIPGLSKAYMPQHLKDREQEVIEGICDWLCRASHHLLGRTWRIIYVEPQQSSKVPPKDGATGSKDRVNHKAYQLVLFAENGYDIRHRMGKEQSPGRDENWSNHTEMEVGELLQWLLPWEFNLRMTCPKAFERMKLGLSKTHDTIVFREDQILRCKDYTSANPPPRDRDSRTSDLKKKGVSYGNDSSAVMNDGCGRMSRAAGRAIAKRLGLPDLVPSAFQGRISGAKGLWLVDTADEPTGYLDEDASDYWIELFDSQVKINDLRELDFEEPDRRTFEVVAWSRDASPGSLNFQLIPILMEGSIIKDNMRKVLATLMEADVISSISGLELALDSPIALRKWIQDVHPVGEERAAAENIKMTGSLPSSGHEKIIWLLEHGFEPKTCRYLKDELCKVARSHGERLESKGRIAVGRSTYLYVAADPYGILEEDEVHLSFSSVFRDERSGFEDIMLDGMDVLVARMPALLRSDMQKRKAVFRRRLRKFRDVILFSSKGKSPLAAALSGGDYDGDKVWIFWDPEIVNNFESVDPPNDCDEDELEKSFGITRESTTIENLLESPDPITEFLDRGIRFALRDHLLGKCATFHERLCYEQNTIDSTGARKIAQLCGLLVDGAKQGRFFPDSRWSAYRITCDDIPTHMLPEPAYKAHKDSGSYTGTDHRHILDYLRFDVAKPAIERRFGGFYASLESVPARDEQLTQMWRETSALARTSKDAEMKKALNELESAVYAAKEAWNMSFPGDDGAAGKAKFGALVEKAHRDFHAIIPIKTTAPVVEWWRKDAASPGSHWSLLRASLAFYISHGGNFVWHVTGQEVAMLKAKASPSFNAVITPLYLSYKVDSTYIKRVESKLLYGTPVDSHDEDANVPDSSAGSFCFRSP